MKTNPTFSVIIPVYNVEKYLNHCLDSVIIQTYHDYEIICINDGSTDNCPVILNEYAEENDKIRIINQENKGLSAARNRGIKEAKGDYLFFLDSDDWIETNTLEVLEKQLVNNDYDVLCFKGKIYNEAEKIYIYDEDLDEEVLGGWDYYNKYALKLRNFHFVSSVLRLYKRQFLLENKLFFKEGIFHEDNLFTPIVCYNAKSIKIINQTLYAYRIRGGSITQKMDFKKLIDKITIANTLSSFFIPLSVIKKENIYKILANAYIGVFVNTLKLNSHEKLSEVKKLINYNYFRTVCISVRHKWLYMLIYLNPNFLNIYYKFVLVINKYIHFS